MKGKSEYMLNKNSKEKSIAFEAIVSVLTFVVTTLLDQTHLNLSLKIILCLIFIIILLIIIKFLKINKTDINTYTSMRDNLFRVENILDNLRRNDQSIDIIWFDELNDFINLYSSKLHNFTDKKANRKLKKFLSSLAEINNIITENNRNNAPLNNVQRVRIDFTGTYGDFDKSKVENSEQNRKEYNKKLENCIKDFKDFYEYCENKYYTDKVK